jgi:hypothetical protein
MKAFKYKKSQAALEFLTTYAWAFLVILIMVGALAYFGILNPSKLLPDRCNFGSEVSCDKNRMIVNNEKVTEITSPGKTPTDRNVTAMRLSNSFGTAVYVTDVKINMDVSGIGTCIAYINGVDPNSTPSDAGVTWPSGSTVTLHGYCKEGDNLVENEKIKMNIEIDYYAVTAGPSYTKTIFGEIFTSVQ